MKFQCERCGLCCILPLLEDKIDGKYFRKNKATKCPHLELNENGRTKCKIYDKRPDNCSGFTCYRFNFGGIIVEDSFELDQKTFNWLIKHHKESLRQHMIWGFVQNSKINHRYRLLRGLRPVQNIFIHRARPAIFDWGLLEEEFLVKIERLEKLGFYSAAKNLIEVPVNGSVNRIRQTLEKDFSKFCYQDKEKLIHRILSSLGLI